MIFNANFPSSPSLIDETFEPVLNELVAKAQRDLSNESLSPSSKEFTEYLDALDPLKHLQDRFHIPTYFNIEQNEQRKCIYFCGHSLGPCAKQSQVYVNQELERWQKFGVLGHFVGKDPWVRIDDLLTPHFESICGAKPGECVAMNSLTVNLNLLLVSFYRPVNRKKKILIERGCFPSDFYAAQSQLSLHNNDPIHDLIQVDADNASLLATIMENRNDLALVLLPGVQYYNGCLLDIRGITKLCRDLGIIIGWDLAHAVGNVPLSLSEWGVDFAVWCSYKYLNGGPGAIGGAYINERHLNSFFFSKHHAITEKNALSTSSSLSSSSSSPDNKLLLGWWGHDHRSRFDMNNQFEPYQSAYILRNSNPDVLTIMSLKGSLETIADLSSVNCPQFIPEPYYAPFILRRALIETLNADHASHQTSAKYNYMQVHLRLKSIVMTGLLEHFLNARFAARKVLRIITPQQLASRGSQLSILFNLENSSHRINVKDFCQRLEDAGAIVDYRKPNVIRLAPIAAYCRFGDINAFIDLFSCKLESMLSANTTN